MKARLLSFFIAVPLIVVFVGCQNLPGSRKTQGAVIGGAAGAAAGAAIAKDNRALGAVLGGLLGAGGGYVIAAKTDKTHDTDSAAQAMRKSQENPATPEEARKAMTADLNYDGFVTLDEVVAMKQAGFSDAEMIQRLRATDQVFELTAEQQQYLRDRGVNQNVINQMVNMNRSGVTAEPQRGDVISQPSVVPQ
jgi:hypothetical protein